MTVAVGTSLVVIVANSAAGLASHTDGLGGNWSLTATFAGAAIAGSLVASRWADRVNADRLRTWFAYLVLAVAGYVLVDAAHTIVT